MNRADVFVLLRRARYVVSRGSKGETDKTEFETALNDTQFAHIHDSYLYVYKLNNKIKIFVENEKFTYQKKKKN